MLGRLRSEAAWHAATVTRVIRATAPWAFLVPALGAAIIWLLNTQPAISPYLEKDSAEFASVVVLGVTLIFAGYVALARRDAYHTWLALFAFALFMRELHLPGTNTGFYIAIVLLLWWASHARPRLEPFISDRAVVTLLMTILWTYVVTKLLDRHYLDAVLPAGITNDLFEENLELLGHLLFLLLVALSAMGGEPALADGRIRN